MELNSSSVQSDIPVLFLFCFFVVRVSVAIVRERVKMTRFHISIFPFLCSRVCSEGGCVCSHFCEPFLCEVDSLQSESECISKPVGVGPGDFSGVRFLHVRGDSLMEMQLCPQMGCGAAVAEVVPMLETRVSLGLIREGWTGFFIKRSREDCGMCCCLI